MPEIWRDICSLLYPSSYDKVLIPIKRNLETKLRCRKNDLTKKRKSRFPYLSATSGLTYFVLDPGRNLVKCSSKCKKN